METNQEINNSNIKVKYLNTESNLRIKQFPFVYTLKGDIIHKFNYRLFKFNEINKEKNINKYFSCDKNDLQSIINIRNFNRNKISIKNLKQFNSNYKHKNLNKTFINTMNYFFTQPNNDKSKNNNLIKIQRNKPFSSKYRNYLQKMEFNKNNEDRSESFDRKNYKIYNKQNDKKEINFCLIPLFYKHKIRNNKYKNNKKYIKSVLYNKLEKNININNNIFANLNTSQQKKNRIKLLNRKKNNIFKLKNKSLDLKADENDMETKVRFANLKKELLQETLKINKMFCDFDRKNADKVKKI